MIAMVCLLAISAPAPLPKVEHRPVTSCLTYGKYAVDWSNNPNYIMELAPHGEYTLYQGMRDGFDKTVYRIVYRGRWFVTKSQLRIDEWRDGENEKDPQQVTKWSLDIRSGYAESARYPGNKIPFTIKRMHDGKTLAPR